ncbi:MAG: hypothetical protein COZ15_03125 [Elusimicrobia bacterium CG_4_10_14_3_um_filter_49_12_50_7]|nr:MAG: hypothetical protein COS41_05315 [Elusimicrobia bacterium CG03_land_8_20_14_0_80_50_18]PIX15413.1 MAG: hypothetical protein COZ72_03475 [Elusimicrobia bacterium CG_4_8_14_3_um_filter_50_9]PIY17287.1 MAG: hypothetical protein COZ15_03125 [Elusimicrobia bacterium CG_4_10_14_3_um_filter_49_12_50_7]
MVRVVVVAHDDLASHFLKSAEELLGTMEGVYARDFTRRQSTGELVDELGKLVDLSGGDDVFILTDFLGGSPCNCACHFIAKNNVWIISGVNLPMLIEIMMKKDKMPPAELCEVVIKAARDSIADVCAKFLEGVGARADETKGAS